MILITDTDTHPDSKIIGCDVNSSLRVDVGPLLRVCSKAQSVFAQGGVKIPIGAVYVGVVVILDGRTILGFFYPKFGTVWLGKASDSTSFAARFTKGGDLAVDYESAMRSIFAFRMAGHSEIARSSDLSKSDLSKSDTEAIKKAELKRQRKAQSLAVLEQNKVKK